jgi:hypothetical protein
VVKDFTILNEKDEIFCHPKVPYIKCCPVAVADSFRVSKEALFPTEHQLDYDRQQLIMECIVEAKEFSDADRQEHIHLISQSLQDDPILFQWFEDSIKPNMDQIRREIKRNFPVPFLSPRFHGANALEEYGVQDVYELGFACCPLVGFPHYQAQTVMT